MEWIIVLDNGECYKLTANGLLEISMELQNDGHSEYDILSITRLSN